MGKDTVGLVYAQALFDAGKAAKRLESVSSSLQVVLDVYKADAEIRRFLTNPTVEKNDKRLLIAKVFSDLEEVLVKNFLGVLVRKDRFGSFEDMAQAFNDLLLKEKGVMYGSLEVASAFDSEDKKALEARLSSRFGRQVTLQEKVNPEILGGFRVAVADTVVDASVLRQLEKINQAMLKGELPSKVWEN